MTTTVPGIALSLGLALVACGSEPTEPSGSAAGSGAGAGTGAAGGVGTATSAAETPVGAVVARPSEIEGQSVATVGRVFFLNTCPPCTDESATCQCSPLMGFLTDDTRTSLDYNQAFQQGIAIAEDDVRITCAPETATNGACAGWTHGGRYRVSGVVRRLVLNGKPTNTFYLNLDEHELL